MNRYKIFTVKCWEEMKNNEKKIVYLKKLFVFFEEDFG